MTEPGQVAGEGLLEALEQMDEGERDKQYARWKKAVERTLDWTD